jgi:hypothetical protein
MVDDLKSGTAAYMDFYPTRQLTDGGKNVTRERET